MAKFHLLCDNEVERIWIFHCPACKAGHWVRDRGVNKPCWKLSGLEIDKPTVSPSILVRGCLDIENPIPEKHGVCHSFIENGMIRFLSDCTHSLAGKTIELEDFDKMVDQ